MTIDCAMLKAALDRWCVQMKAVAPELNRADGQLGDGDLGATLEKCAANVAVALPEMPEKLQEIFKACSLASAKASGSSFGTLLVIAFVTAAKSCAGRSTLETGDLSRILTEIGSAMSARGGASLGDKTVLDPLHAVAEALESLPEGTSPQAVALQATRHTIEAFREQPSRIGRARMFPAKSIGMDDPGMIAFERMIECL